MFLVSFFYELGDDKIKGEIFFFWDRDSSLISNDCLLVILLLFLASISLIYANEEIS